MRGAQAVQMRTLTQILIRCGRRQRELFFDIVRLTAGRLPMRSQSGRTNVLLVTALANVRPIVGVQPLVQLQMNELREFLRTQIACVRLLAAVQSQMRLQIAGAREALLTDFALMRFLAGMHQMVLLQMGQLRERFGAHVAAERPLAGVRSQMYLQIGQLTEGFGANVALVVHFAVLLLERIRQRTVAATAAARTQWTAARTAVGTETARRRRTHR